MFYDNVNYLVQTFNVNDEKEISLIKNYIMYLPDIYTNYANVVKDKNAKGNYIEDESCEIDFNNIEEVQY